MQQQEFKANGRKRHTRLIATLAALVAVVALALGGSIGSAGAAYHGGDVQQTASWSG